MCVQILYVYTVNPYLYPILITLKSILNENFNKNNCLIAVDHMSHQVHVHVSYGLLSK